MNQNRCGVKGFCPFRAWEGTKGNSDVSGCVRGCVMVCDGVPYHFG